MSADTRHDHETDDSVRPGDDGVIVLAEHEVVATTTRSGWRRRLSMAERAARSMLSPVWSDPRIGFAAAASAGAFWGLAAGWWTPRGPLTTGEALWSIVISLLVGTGAGLVWRSRWAMLVSPVAFVVVFELVRSGTDGPTVDGIGASTYGAVAFVVGRGFQGLVSLFPMLLGVAIGAGAARKLSERPASATHKSRRSGRRVAAVLSGTALLALTVGLARPASTDSIVDATGNVIPGSVAELTAIDVNGHDLGLMIRGHDVNNPVLLFLAGGPGGSEYGAMRRHLPELEKHFTVVTWDQRGAGTSYSELDPTDTITPDGYVSDTIVVTNYLRERFGKEKVYLLGQSWGTTLGVLAVQQHPELFAAFVGTGQMVSERQTDQIFYQDTLAWAQKTGNDALVDELKSIGPPPYDRMLSYETALTNEQNIKPYDHSPNSEGAGGFAENLFVSEYALIDQVHALGAFMDTFAALYPQLQDIDFRKTATSFAIPMFFVEGANEAHGRAEPFDEWYPMIDAPIKDVAVLETSGHRPLWEQPKEFVDYMVDTVLAQTGASS